jgi:hypothetical protein
MTDILADLKDLEKQATTERSHYYVAACTRRAVREIERLRAALAPFAAVDVDRMLSLEEADLDKEDFYRAHAALAEVK